MTQHNPIVLRLCVALAAFSACATPVWAQEAPYFRTPSGSEYAKVVPGGRTILPNGRFVTPKGQRLYTSDNLWYVAVRPDGKVLAEMSDGAMVIHSLPAKTGDTSRVMLTKDLWPVGIFTKDGTKLIVSDGEGGGIQIFDTAGWDIAAKRDANKPFATFAPKPVATISANAGKFNASYINDLVLSPDEKYAYGADIAHQSIVVFNLTLGTIAARVPAGREPYALALSEDGKRLYVANIGVFDYTAIPAPREGSGFDKRGISRPAFAYPSKESEEGVKNFEGRDIAGIGKPQVPDAQSVWQYNVSDPAHPAVSAKATAGLLIQAPSDRGKAIGGSAPNKLLLRGNRLFVSNANNDTVQIFNATTLKSEKIIKITPSPLVQGLRGVIPSGLALTKDGKRLYVAESGLNAVAVIDPNKGSILGHIPTGWFPVPLALSPDEKMLFIGTQKGIGRGPRGAKNRRPDDDERAGLPDMPGMTDALTVPDDASLVALTQEVLVNNGIVDKREEARALPAVPLSRFPGKMSPEIKHIVYIIKENHTFDGIFGTLKGAKGEPEYAEWGDKGWIREKDKNEKLSVMPNHLRLAQQFSISDNFYMEPNASGDGHRWLVGVYPSLWTTRVFYSGWNFSADNNARGRMISFGSNASQIPEDYLENGSLWEHLQRNKISFRNYGEGFEFAGVGEDEKTTRTGATEVINFPMPKALWDNTCFDFPIFNMNIPDIAKADWFFEDVVKYRKANKGKLPQVMTIALSNDHGSEPKPKLGYPYISSWMADNDLALGRIVEYLSKTPEWRNMAIFVTQDDSGGDGDHIDRHRSFVLMISPYAKRGYVSNVHTSIMSIVKTTYLLCGLGPNNMFDALASDLSDMFTMTPDFTPYTHVPVDRRIFREEDTFDPTDPKFERRRKLGSPVALDDPNWLEKMRDSQERDESQPQKP